MSKRVRHGHLLCLDLELTCWEQEAPPGQHPEIIEIGLAEVDLVGLTVSRTHSVLCRPVRSEISGYCTALTGITPERMKAEGIHLPDALNRIRKEYGSANKAWLAWGADNQTLAAACDARGVQSPFSDTYFDLGALFRLSFGLKDRTGLLDALDHLGMTFEGQPHRAETDATNTARLFIELSRRQRAFTRQ